MEPASNQNQTRQLDTINQDFEQATPQEIIKWAANQFGTGLAMTSSFGAQSAVLLHLATSILPDIPIIVLDTGYFFPETYRFIQQLQKQLKLNLKIFNPQITAARQEALYGQLWNQGVQGMTQYHQLNKIEPMQRALKTLNITAWMAGLRRQQTQHRAQLPHIINQNKICKIHPILKWNTKQINQYLSKHNLPYHPLVEQGYLSIGDTHSTSPITPGMDERDGRFKGLKQECGLHIPHSHAEKESRDSSAL